MQFQYSTRGVRENNEDSVCLGDNYLAVADGMGGHDNGELASQALITEWSGSRLSELPFEMTANSMRENCQALVARVAGRNSGTTFTGGLIRRGWLHYLHCGDSAMFIMRRQPDESYLPSRLTTEQNTWGARRLREPQTSKYGKSRLLSCVMGGRGYAPPEWEAVSTPVHAGDIVVAATDGFIGAYEDATGELGLYRMMEEILDSLIDHDALRDMVDRAAEESLDNATLAFIVVGK